MTPTGSFWLAISILILAFYLFRCARDFGRTGELQRSLFYFLVAGVGVFMAGALFVIRV